MPKEKITCTQCGGSRTEPCKWCKGRGCGSCRRTGEMNCLLCAGRGYIYVDK